MPRSLRAVETLLCVTTLLFARSTPRARRRRIQPGKCDPLDGEPGRLVVGIRADEDDVVAVVECPDRVLEHLLEVLQRACRVVEPVQPRDLHEPAVVGRVQLVVDDPRRERVPLVAAAAVDDDAAAACIVRALVSERSAFLIIPDHDFTEIGDSESAQRTRREGRFYEGVGISCLGLRQRKRRFSSVTGRR